MLRVVVASALLAVLGYGPALAQADMSSDPTLAPAGSYTLDKARSSVTLKVSHLGLSFFTLRLDGLSGGYTYDPTHPEASRLDVAISANSVDTGDAALNSQIASQVFDADKYPQIRFVSTSVRPGAEGRGTVVGALTFHGVTKPVTLDVVFNGAGQDERHQERMGFSATTQIHRADFGASALAPSVGDDVSVVIEAEFTK